MGMMARMMRLVWVSVMFVLCLSMTGDPRHEKGGVEAQFLFPLPQPAAFGGFGGGQPDIQLQAQVQARAQAAVEAQTKQADATGPSTSTAKAPSVKTSNIIPAPLSPSPTSSRSIPTTPEQAAFAVSNVGEPAVDLSMSNISVGGTLAEGEVTIKPLTTTSQGTQKPGGAEDLQPMATSNDPLSAVASRAVQETTSSFTGERAMKPPPILLLPGFASTRMNSWLPKKCMGNMGFNVGDRVWLDTAKVVGFGACWIDCMILSPYNMTDLPEGCKLRAVQGTEAIGELDPGLITGRLTSIWQLIIRRLSESFNYDSFGIVAAPYDFRIPPPVLDARDNYFYRLMKQIEVTVASQKKYKEHARRQGTGEIVCDEGVVVLAHSMGNNIFRYFLEWLKHEKGGLHYQKWIDEHIAAYYAVGAPLTGSLESIKAMITGLTFGLPISLAEARRMGTTFGSTGWMFPYTPKFKHISPSNTHEWPTHAVKLIYPQMSSKNNSMLDDEDRERIRRLAGQAKAYHPSKLHKLWRDLKAFDEVGDRVISWERDFYKGDKIMDHSLAWERPPIKKVYCVYGVNMKTELAQTYKGTVSPKAASPGELDISWSSTDIVYEEGGRIYSEAGDPSVESFVPNRKSGDLTVPYHSLSLCHQWLGAHVNVTKIPQRVYFPEELGTTKTGNEPSITFYESPSHTITGIMGEEIEVETAVWEIDNADHRGVIQSDSFLRELKEELAFHIEQQYEKQLLLEEQEAPYHHDHHSNRWRSSAPHFASKQARIPRSDEDCVWDYLAARCKYSEYCEYNYHFGDLTLDNSCRLRQAHRTDGHHFHHHHPEHRPPTTACQCKSPCVSGFCEYVGNCNRATQPFGPNNGWWGPCENLKADFDPKEATRVP